MRHVSYFLPAGILASVMLAAPSATLGSGSFDYRSPQVHRAQAIHQQLAGSGNEAILYAFKGGGGDGSAPRAGLVADGTGALYGTTSGGSGTVFKLTPTESGYAESVLYTLPGGKGGSDPNALFIDGTGALYASTCLGGPHCKRVHGCGTVFKLTPSGSGYAASAAVECPGISISGIIVICLSPA